jgi:aminotransferase in exopolysaccharide biosynthesis
MSSQLAQFIRDLYRTTGSVPLHAPTFARREREYVLEAIDSTFVSSVGAFVDRFEQEVANYTGCARAVATVNGTAALHVALRLAGVRQGSLVITQALTFVATCNAIAYCGAAPVFIDVDLETLGLSPGALEAWLSENAYMDAEGACRSIDTNQEIPACLPMHTFGHPADLEGLLRVCADWNIVLVEDAAEALGSLYKGRHAGTFGALGVLSFNGNKILTTGGGGMILADEKVGIRAKHLTTTAKVAHPYEYHHDEIGYNYRLPNLNAALGCAQLERIEEFVASKREIAGEYARFLSGGDLQFISEPADCRSNYWLNAVLCQDRAHRDALLVATNAENVMTRPIWSLMSDLPMYSACRSGDLTNSIWLRDRIVNLPSSVRSRETTE